MRIRRVTTGQAEGGKGAVVGDEEVWPITVRLAVGAEFHRIWGGDVHTSDTVDVTFIVSGQATLELDGGAQVTLDAGDCVVQNGIRRAWRNPTSEPCTMAVAIVGARRTSDR